MPEPAQFSVGGPRARGTAPLAEPAESVVLHPEQSASRFDHQHHPVPAGLDDFVLNFWTVTWSVDEPYTAKVLPLPTVHATVTNTECDVTGLVRGRYDRHLTGTGYGVGARFRPGCVRAFIDRPVAELTDRAIPMAALTGHDTGQLARAVAATEDPGERVGLLAGYLSGLDPAPDPIAQEVSAVVTRILADPEIVRVDQVAALLGCGVRTVQRLFREYVGAGPKWLIGRRRVLAAAAAADGPDGPGWAELASALGFSDQAHLIRRFTESVGTTPTRYQR